MGKPTQCAYQVCLAVVQLGSMCRYLGLRLKSQWGAFGYSFLVITILILSSIRSGILRVRFTWNTRYRKQCFFACMCCLYALFIFILALICSVPSVPCSCCMLHAGDRLIEHGHAHNHRPFQRCLTHRAHELVLLSTVPCAHHVGTLLTACTT